MVIVRLFSVFQLFFLVGFTTDIGTMVWFVHRWVHVRIVVRIPSFAFFCMLVSLVRRPLLFAFYVALPIFRLLNLRLVFWHDMRRSMRIRVIPIGPSFDFVSLSLLSEEFVFHAVLDLVLFVLLFILVRTGSRFLQHFPPSLRFSFQLLPEPFRGTLP